MKQLLSSLFVVFGLLSHPVESFGAERVLFEILPYGGRYAVVTLSGPGAKNVTSSLSSNKKSIKVSGAQVAFVQRNPKKLKSLIQNVQQVRRGQFTDLVFSTIAPVQLTVTRSSNDIKLLVKAERKKRQTPPEKSTQKNKDSSKQIQKRNVPTNIQIVQGKKVPQAPPESLTIVLPEASKLPPQSSLTREIRALAFGIDLLWSWLTTRTVVEGDEEQFILESPEEIIRQQEELIEDLTAELLLLRQNQNENTAKTP